MKKIIYTFVLSLVVVSCSTSKLPPKSVAYKGIFEESPVSILALPPINRSTKVDAKELFYSSLTVPLTQKGYYTFPPLLAMEILKEESAYDAELFLDQSMKRVGEVFGVDAVLFTIIHAWDKTVFAGQIRVKIEYILKSTKTDEILFNRIGDITLSFEMNSNSIAGLLSSLVATALTKEIVVGRYCNDYTLVDLPSGFYSPTHKQDSESPSATKEFKVTLTEIY